MKCRFEVVYAGLLSLFLAAPSACSAENETFTESVIIFNTICAKCHEAQCSGRLSFDDALEASTNHILRHYGQASGKPWLQKELFQILNYMKGKCAYYPMQAPVPLKRSWSGEVLEKFATLIEKNYFIPVGHFEPGHYHIRLELEQDVKATVHLISAEFEMAIEDCFQSNDRQIIIPVHVQEPGDYYFRMYPKTPTRIIKIDITPQNRDGVL